MAAENSIRILFNVYMDDGLGASTTMIGGLTAAGQLLAAFIALAGPALNQRFGRVPVITFGAAAMALCLVPLAMVGHWAVAGATSMALITLSSIRRSVYIVFQQEMVAERWRVDHEFGADDGLWHQYCRNLAGQRLADRNIGLSGAIWGFDTDNLAPCAMFSYLFSHASWRIRK